MKTTLRLPGRKPAGLKNIGPVSSRWLAEVGVRSLEDLERLGSVAVFRAVRRRQGRKPSILLLYALEAALMDLRWDRLPEAVKKSLRQRVDTPARGGRPSRKRSR